jgi:hypothetical protein
MSRGERKGKKGIGFHSEDEYVVLEVNDVKTPKELLFTHTEIDAVRNNLERYSMADKVVCSSSTNESTFSEGKMHGFVEAIVTAFRYHYPLALRPQHLWLLILQAVAQDIAMYPEELRSKWIVSDRKRELIMQGDEFQVGKKFNFNWVDVVLDDCRGDSIMNQIQDCYVEEAYDDMMCEFTETSMSEKLSMALTGVETLPNNFQVIVRNQGGFPYIIMERNEDDWQLLRIQAEQLITTQCSNAFAARWLPTLLPLLEKLHTEYQQVLIGKETGRDRIDIQFWQSMCKRGGLASSGYIWLNGWFNIFFPHVINEQPNPFCVPYSSRPEYVTETVEVNVDLSKVMGGLSAAPVSSNSVGQEMSLTLHAGFLCAKQDPISRVIAPHIGWYIAQCN